MVGSNRTFCSAHGIHKLIFPKLNVFPQLVDGFRVLIYLINQLVVFIFQRDFYTLAIVIFFA